MKSKQQMKKKSSAGENASQGNENTPACIRIVEKERLVAEARRFNLLSNVFMSVALDDKMACQHVLRILTGMKDLTVLEVRVQHRVSKITSHDAILDILAEDSSGKLFNLEIQRADTIDHARRTRFYGAMVDSEYLMKGKTYADLPDVYIIYISKKDLWKAGQTSYQVEKYFKGTGVRYDDGQHILYVNAAVDDGSETARLMQYFKTADPDDMSQGDLSKRVHFLKCEEGGYEIMCEVSEMIYAEGELDAKRTMAYNMHKKGYPASTIAELLEVSMAIVKEWIDSEMAAVR